MAANETDKELKYPSVKAIFHPVACIKSVIICENSWISLKIFIKLKA
jgi:hypothetical protein